MGINETLDNIYKKVELLAQRLEKSQALNKAYREEIRSLENQLNQYSEEMGSLEMEIIELKKGLEKKK
jgi:predicted nuclease with TOPRIM domain